MNSEQYIHINDFYTHASTCHIVLNATDAMSWFIELSTSYALKKGGHYIVEGGDIYIARITADWICARLTLPNVPPYVPEPPVADTIDLMTEIIKPVVVPTTLPITPAVVNPVSYNSSVDYEAVRSVVHMKDAKITVCSIDIANALGRDHSDVLRDIRKMLTDLGIGEGKFAGSYVSAQNKKLPCFDLDKRRAITLMTRYSFRVGEILQDRIEELENEAVVETPALSKEEMTLMVIQDLQDQIEDSKAAVAYLEICSQAPDTLSVADTAKVGKMPGGELWLFDVLRRDGYIMSGKRGEDNRNNPYQKSIKAGWLVMVTGQYFDKKTGKSNTYTQTRVTPKGVAFFTRRYSNTQH